MPGSRVSDLNRSVGSVGSQNSQRSVGKYRTVARGANVDENLFGGAGAARSQVSHGAISKESLDALLSKKPTHVETDSLVINQSELARLKRAATVNPLEEAKLKKAAMEKQREQQQMAARERRKKMMEKEAARKAAQPRSDLDIENDAHDSELRDAYARAKDEQHDDVKHMNRMMLYSKCVAIRDAQLAEKEAIAKEKAEEDRLLDIQMEEARQQAVRLFEEREARKQEERMRGAAIIQQQIEERERERRRLQEIADHERDAMLTQIEKLKAEEKEKEEQRREAGKRLLEEASLANEEQIRRKELHKIELQEEEDRIAAYIAQKEARELAHQEELDRIAQEKAAEVARLRAMQEKAADQQAEQDALRAKRAQEDHEREWRRKERAEALKKETTMKSIMQSREDQMKEKEIKQALAAKQAQEEFERILVVQKAAEAAEHRKHDAAVMSRVKHRDEVKQQINDIEEKRGRDRQEFLEEGNKIRFENAKQLKRLESVKQSKIESLEKAGVPSKYIAELASKKISV